MAELGSSHSRSRMQRQQRQLHGLLQTVKRAVGGLWKRLWRHWPLSRAGLGQALQIMCVVRSDMRE